MAIASAGTAIASGQAAFAFDDAFRVVAWNHAAEQLIGLSAEEAVGLPCWQALRAVDPNGHVVCHSRCPHARRARRGGEPAGQAVLVPSARGGRVRVRLATVTIGRRRPVTIHLLLTDEDAAHEPGPLTPRQHEVLRLLAAGRVAKQVAAELGLAEATVRNHIRDILRRLGAHSQLEAVATARRLGLVA